MEIPDKRREIGFDMLQAGMLVVKRRRGWWGKVKNLKYILINNETVLVKENMKFLGVLFNSKWKFNL